MRDLDDLLDPVVSRRASAAARTPDFESVERRGRQRRRRARAAAVGAVVAVVAAVSVVGSQVASYRSDTAPAGTIEWDGPDGELARAVESGDADSGQVLVSADGSMLTTWSHFTDVDIDTEQYPFTSGLSLAIDGKTYWSPLAYRHLDISRLASGEFVVGIIREKFDRWSYYVADADGLRPVELTDDPADLANVDDDGYAWMYDQQDRPEGIYAFDVENATASLVSELIDVVPDANDRSFQLPQTDDGDLWVIADRPDQPPELVHLTPDGRLSTYGLPAGRLRHWPVSDSLNAISGSRDGRPIVLWSDGEPDTNGRPAPARPLKLTTVSASGTISTADLGMAPGSLQATAAALPDGRLLVNRGTGLLRSSDESWRDFEPVAPPDGMPTKHWQRGTLTATDDSVCLAPHDVPGSEIACTDDGESWRRVDLTP